MVAQLNPKIILRQQPNVFPNIAPWEYFSGISSPDQFSLREASPRLSLCFSDPGAGHQEGAPFCSPLPFLCWPPSSVRPAPLLPCPFSFLKSQGLMHTFSWVLWQNFSCFVGHLWPSSPAVVGGQWVCSSLREHGEATLQQWGGFWAHGAWVVRSIRRITAG